MPFQMYFTGMTEDEVSCSEAMSVEFRNPELNQTRHVIVCAMREYWETVCSRFTRFVPDLPDLPPDLANHAGAGNARETQAFASGVPREFSLQAAYDLTREYAALLPPELRGRYGIFYTPPALTKRLLDSATSAGVDWREASILDPACGGGPFSHRRLRESERRTTSYLAGQYFKNLAT